MRLIVALIASAALSGCSSLNVSWSFVASYNQLVQAQGIAIHAPKEEAPPPAPVPAGKAL